MIAAPLTGRPVTRVRPGRIEESVPDTTRVLWDGIVRLARRFDAFTLQTFNPVYPTPADRS